MKADIINPFLKSVSNVLSTMAMLEVSPGTPSIKSDTISKGDVSGIIGMTTKTVNGSMAITFPDVVAFDIVNRMLGDKVTEIDATVTDLVGELTNMIVGGAKGLLEENGYDIGMATPVVVTGKNHEIVHKAVGKNILMPFKSEAGTFYVEVCFEG